MLARGGAAFAQSLNPLGLVDAQTYPTGAALLVYRPVSHR